MRVLSLFDGISCGLTVLKKLGLSVDRYVSFESSHLAIKSSSELHAGIEYRGVISSSTDFTEFKGFDLLLAGSPCQSFSIAGNKHNFDDLRGELVFEVVRALKEVEPRYYLFENVVPNKLLVPRFESLFGSQALILNSSQFSCQHRRRMYFTNIPYKHTAVSSNVLMADVLTEDCLEKSKLKFTGLQHSRIVGVCSNTYKLGRKTSQNTRVYDIASKSPTVTTSCAIYVLKDYKVFKLNKLGLLRLQGLPDHYHDYVYRNQIGNGWQIDTIFKLLEF